MNGYTVILSPDPNAGGFAAIVPAMPGALTAGTTRSDALDRIALVMAAWLEVAHEDGYGPRVETPELLGQAIADVFGDRAEEGWNLAIEVTVVHPAAAAAA